MATQASLFGDVLEAGEGETPSAGAPPNGLAAAKPKAKRRRARGVQVLLGTSQGMTDAVVGVSQPADAPHRLGPPAELAPANDASPEPVVAKPHSSFPGRDLSPEEWTLHDELRAQDLDRRSLWYVWQRLRPKRRSECERIRQPENPGEGRRPCFKFGCAYHLATSVNEHGSLKIWWPDKAGGVDVEAMPETCALDVVAEHPEGLFNNQIADFLNMSEEGARLVVEEALVKMWWGLTFPDEDWPGFDEARAEMAERDVSEHDASEAVRTLLGIRTPAGKTVGRRVVPDEPKPAPIGSLCAWHDTGRPPEVPSNAWLEADCPTCQEKLRRGVLTGREPRIVEYLRQKEAGIRARRRNRGGGSSSDPERAHVSGADASDHGTQHNSNLSSVRLTQSEEIDT